MTSMYNLGVLYADGIGAKPDQAAAVFWYDKAAKAGNTRAMNNLGLMYMNGWGVAQDRAMGVTWPERRLPRVSRSPYRTCSVYTSPGRACLKIRREPPSGAAKVQILGCPRRW